MPSSPCGGFPGTKQKAHTKTIHFHTIYASFSNMCMFGCFFLKYVFRCMQQSVHSPLLLCGKDVSMVSYINVRGGIPGTKHKRKANTTNDQPYIYLSIHVFRCFFLNDQRVAMDYDYPSSSSFVTKKLWSTSKLPPIAGSSFVLFFSFLFLFNGKSACRWLIPIQDTSST